MRSDSVPERGPARVLKGVIDVACPLCSCNESVHLFQAKDWTLGVSGDDFGVRRCRDCGAGFLSPRPRARDIADYYPTRYYWSYEQGGSPLSWDDIVARRARQLEAKARVLADIKPGRLLDIGAQKGEFIWYMGRRGWSAEGIELDNSVPNPESLPIRYGDFLEMSFEPESFDLITAWAVLEHVYEPQPIVEKIKTLLKPGGRFVALVTNLNSIQGRFYRADDFPRHLTLFTRKSARALAARNGLSVERIWTDQRIFGGAVNGGLVYLAKRLCGYPQDQLFAEWKNVDDPLLFYGKWRGVPSSLLLNLSRIDRAITYLPEKVLDALGFGFNMTLVLRKPEL